MLASPTRTLDTGDMGFNPFRKQRNSAADITIVAVFALVTVAVVLWGFFG